MQMLRLFIALDFDPEMIQTISNVIHFLQRKKMDSVRWVDTNLMHLTLRFLGDTDSTRQKKFHALLTTACQNTSPFQIVVEGSGCFPTMRQPRVLWVGVKGPPDLAALQQKIEKGVREAGFAGEERAFNPHLTLGRVSRFASNEELRAISRTMMDYEVGRLGTCQVDHITLYQSTLDKKGPIYNPLGRYTLG